MRTAGKAELALLTTAQEPLPWRRSVAWLLFLGPFFFLSYGFANWWAGHMATPRVVVFDWERQIPFVPWTIVPYWSIDLLYGLSFLLCRTRRAVDIHALRLLSVQLICVICFVLFPLQFSFVRPPTDGILGSMFAALEGFDKPFNQAPSLHLALLVVLWVRYAEMSRGILLVITHVWAGLIALSVLTTYQHHFIDLPTGVLVGLLCVWLLPDDMGGSSIRWQLTPSAIQRRLAKHYMMGGFFCGSLAVFGGAALWLIWPAVSLCLISIIYLCAGSDGFQKQGGKLNFVSSCLLAPYIVGAWLNSRLWTWRDPAPVLITDGVWLGRMPTERQMTEGYFSSLCDLSTELPAPKGTWMYANFPWLDLVPQDTKQLGRVAVEIEKLRSHGPVLVCCALGFSRSAAAVAAWLLVTKRANNVSEAIAKVALRRPSVVLGPEDRTALEQLIPKPSTIHNL